MGDSGGAGVGGGVQIVNRHHLLTPFQENLLRALFGMPEAASFGLFGGTALVEFHLGHRISEDLDLFTFDWDSIRPLGLALERSLTLVLATVTVRRTRSLPMFQEFLCSDGQETVKVQLAPADQPQLGAIEGVDGLRIGHLRDLVAGKLHAFYDREEPRDAVDVWAIVNRLGIDLGEGERDLFAKDAGLSEARLDWAASFLRKARTPMILPPSLQAMLRIELSEAALRSFLRQEGERAIQRAGEARAPLRVRRPD